MNLNITAEAAELFAASWCNLDCTYCRIPKHNQMILDQHAQIIKDVIAVTPVIDRLKKIYSPDRLTHISHWGSEPTLTLQYFNDFYKVAIKEFPRLRNISMSTNFMTRPETLTNFFSTFSPDHAFNISIQMSLDGEPWVTEVNRGKGTTPIIQDNIVKFIRAINEMENMHHVITIHFKSTMSKDQYESLLSDDRLAGHYAFFDALLKRMHGANSKNRIVIKNNVDPTVVCPDKYTKRDGVILSDFYRAVEKLRAEERYVHVVPSFASYYGALDIILRLHRELFTKSRMFTCSAGDSQFGVSEYLHPCHDTFYLPYNEVQDAIENDLDRRNSTRELENLKSGRISRVQKSMFVKIDGLTQHKVDKYQRLMRGFHDFFRFRISYSMAVIKAMAKCGQVNSCYANDEMATLLAIYTTNRHSCLTANVQYAGSIHLTDMAFFKLFGNGLLEQLLQKGLSK